MLLWVAVNERDMLGSDGPPDYMSAVELGDFRLAVVLLGRLSDHRVKPETRLAAICEAPGLRAWAAHRLARPGFAADSRPGGQFMNGAFVGQHGSWNRQPVSGYKVIYVPFGDKGFPLPNVKPVDVLTGFLDKNGNARGRPVGVTFDATGSLLVADDVGNVIWRVSSASPQPAPAAAPAAK